MTSSKEPSQTVPRDGSARPEVASAPIPGQIARGQDEQVEACHEVGLYLLDEFTEICSRHGIPFFLDAGTLLGAVRHGGWIPWDDDVDVCMLREDYEHLAALPASEFPEGLALSLPGRERSHVTSVPRLNYLRSGLIWVETLGVIPPERQRIVLDIYILERPPSEPLVPLWLAATRVLQVIAAARGTNLRRVWSAAHPAHERTMGAVLVALSRLAPLRGIHRLNGRLASCARKERPHLYALNHSRSMRATRLEASWFESDLREFFEGRSCPVPEPGPYLEALYGADYMTPPPASRRIGHHYDSFWAEFGGHRFGELPREIG